MTGAELLGWIGIGLLVVSLTGVGVLIHRAPLRPDLDPELLDSPTRERERSERRAA